MEVVTTMNQQTKNPPLSNPNWEKRIEHIRDYLGDKSYLLDEPNLRDAFFAGWNYSEHSNSFKEPKDLVYGRYTNVSRQSMS